MAIDPGIPALALRGLQQSEPFDLGRTLDQAALTQERQAAAQQAQRQMAAQQRLQQLAQQYGSDPDELVKQLGTEFPEQAQKLSQEIGKARYEGAQAHLAQTKDAQAQISAGLSLLQGTTADTWKPVRQMLVKMAPQLDPVLDQEYSDEGKQRAISMGLSAEQWTKGQQEAAQLYVDGKHDVSAARLLASADNPQKRSIAEGLLKQAGLSQYAAMWQSPQDAQGYLDAQKKADPEKAAKVGSFEDYVTRKFGANPTPAQVLQARKEYGQADDRPRVSVSVAGGTTGGLTTGEGGGLEYAGTLARIMGRIPVGLARSGGAATAVMNEAARQTKMLGQKPIDSMLRSAIYQGDSKALAQVQKMHSAADAYESKAMGQLDIVDSLSDKVARTQYPILNSAIMSAKTNIAGDPDATLLLNAIQTASTEYAKIMMGGTASASAITDSAQKEAQKLLNAAMSKGTLRKATALMRQEMDLTMNGFDASEKHIAEKMGGAGGAAGVAPAQAPAAKQPDYRFNPTTGKLERVQ